MTERDTRVLLGHIAGAHGVRGEVRVRTQTETPQAIADYGPVQDEAGERRFAIVAARAAKDGAVARIEGIDTRAAAEALKGTALYVERAAMPDDIEEGSYYQADLIGVVAINADGAALGQVVSVQNFGAGDLLEVRPASGGQTVLVPFTKEIVPDVELDAGWLLMLPPEGLFEE